MTDNQRAPFESAVVERLKETGFLEIEIRTECLVRCEDGYQDEVINAGWHYWNAALAAEPTQQHVTDKAHPRFIAGYSAGLNDARLEAGDTPPPQSHSIGAEKITARAIQIICREAEEMGFPEDTISEFRSGQFDGDDLLTLQAVERALAATATEDGR